MNAHLSLLPQALAEVTRRLDEANARIRQLYPGESGDRQPVHSVYGGAHLFKAGGHRRLGDLALASMDEYAPDFVAFARALGLPGAESLPESPAEVASLAAALEAEPTSAGANPGRSGRPCSTPSPRSSRPPTPSGSSRPGRST